MSFRRGAAAIGVGNALSKVLGVAREVLFAYTLGTGALADAFRLALSLVLIPTHFVTGELSLASVVPVLRRASLSSPEAGRKVGHQFSLALVAYGFVLALLLVFGANALVAVFAPGFDATSQGLARRFLRVLGLASPFYALASACVILTIAQGRFRLTAVKPVVQNLGLLAGLLFFLRFHLTALLAWGFVAAYLGLSLAGLREVRSANSRLVPGQATVPNRLFHWREIWDQMRALSILIVVTQCGLIGERMITTLAGTGSVAAIDYARFVTETPSLIIAMPGAIVLLAKFAGGEWNEHAEQGARLCRIVVYTTLPFAVGAVTAARLVVSVVFERGAFGTESAGLVEAALVGSSAGVLTGSLAYVVQRVFSARRRNRDLLAGLIASTVTSLGIALLLVRSQGVLAIGVASSVGQGLYALWGLHRMGMLRALRSVAIPVLCCSAAGMVAWVGLKTTGALQLSRWVLLAPASVTGACLLSFEAVRRDLAWAIPGLARRKGERATSNG